MSEQRRDRLWALFDQAAELPPDEQQALLDTACADDPALRAELERLLANDARLGAAELPAFQRNPLIRADVEPAQDTAASSPAGTPTLASNFGRYRLIRLLAEGGMGAVYLAEQDNPRRTVALKVVRSGFGSPSLLKRFRHESQILGRLHHPGIAQVYEAGLANDGQPFFAMEFIRGLPLDEYARAQAQALPARLELVARVCDAVQHAHDQGVIHRDLKPANILVDEAGQPKVLDFGVARATDGDLLTWAGLTQAGQLLGTPNYMSPEQVTGDPDAIDCRADVYALGVILFELAAHRLPYRLENRPLAETARVILEEEPPGAGTLNPELRGDVETIVAKALEKDRARRYASAAELAADIRRHLGNEPIKAQPPSNIYLLRKFVRRNKAVVGGVAGIIFALVAGLIGTLSFAILESEQRGRAEGNARQADSEKQAALYQAYRASLAAASAALEISDVVAAARNLKSAPEPLQDWEWRHLSSRLDDSSAVVSLPVGGQGFLLPAPFAQPSPAAGGAGRVRNDRLRVGIVTSTGVRLLDLEGGEHTTVPLGPEHTHDGCNVYQTSLGVRVVAWIGNTAFEVLDEAGKVLCRARPTVAGIHRVVVSPDGTRLAVLGGTARIELFDATSGKQIAIWDAHVNSMWTCSFSPDSSRLASGSDDRTARVWDAATGTLLATCRGHTSKVLCAAFSPDGSRLLTASADGTVRQWNPRTGQDVGPPYERHTNEVSSAVYSPDGQLVASAGFDQTIRVWRARDRQDVTVLHGHKGRVNKVEFAADGRRLVSLSCPSPGSSAGDDTVRVWEVDPVTTLPVLRGHTDYVYPVAYSPDGRWLASGCWDKTVRLWDAATGEPCAILPHPSFVLDLAFSPDGTRLVTGCHQDDRLRMWDVATAQVRREIPLPSRDFGMLRVSPDGTHVAVSLYDPESQKRHRLIVCDVASGKPLFSTEGASLAYSPDGGWLAAVAADSKSVLLLDARTYETRARFSGHENYVFKAAFSPDSRHLATCSGDHTVRLWQIGSGACQVLPGHTDEVFAAAFHPGGTRLATGGRDGAVWLWDLARGEAVVQLPGHRSYIWSLAFSPDGATLASGSGDTTVRLWDTAPLKTRYDARRQAAALRPEAERLVEQMWREKNDLGKVAEAIRADPALSEPLRHAALRAVLRRAQPPETVPVNPQDPP